MCWRRDRLPTPVFLGFPCGSAGKESSCNAGDLGSIPGLGRSPAEGKGYPVQYSGLEKSMDYSPWGCKKSDTTERLPLLFHSCLAGRFFLPLRHLGSLPDHGYWDYSIVSIVWNNDFEMWFFSVHMQWTVGLLLPNGRVKKRILG